MITPSRFQDKCINNNLKLMFYLPEQGIINKKKVKVLGLVTNVSMTKRLSWVSSRQFLSVTYHMLHFSSNRTHSNSPFLLRCSADRIENKKSENIEIGKGKLIRLKKLSNGNQKS